MCSDTCCFSQPPYITAQLQCHTTPHSDYLALRDLHVFLGPKDASKAFVMLGAQHEDDHLTLPTMCDAVVALVQERVALAAALKGSKTVVGQVRVQHAVVSTALYTNNNKAMSFFFFPTASAQVGNVVGVIIHIVFVFLYLLVFGYSATQVWVAISGAILGFSFIFASYLSAIFTCTMYLLTVHPFEVLSWCERICHTVYTSVQVGDIIIVNKNYYEVQKILLQHTRLKDSNGAVLWYPNIKMVGESVQNLTRSELLWQSLKVLVVRLVLCSPCLYSIASCMLQCIQ